MLAGSQDGQSTFYWRTSSRYSGREMPGNPRNFDDSGSCKSLRLRSLISCFTSEIFLGTKNADSTLRCSPNPHGSRRFLRAAGCTTLMRFRFKTPVALCILKQELLFFPLVKFDEVQNSGGFLSLTQWRHTEHHSLDYRCAMLVSCLSCFHMGQVSP